MLLGEVLVGLYCDSLHVLRFGGRIFGWATMVGPAQSELLCGARMPM